MGDVWQRMGLVEGLRCLRAELHKGQSTSPFYKMRKIGRVDSVARMPLMPRYMYLYAAELVLVAELSHCL